MVNNMPDSPSSEASRICLVCEDEVPDEHFVVGHLLTPLTLAVCYECFSWRDTWDELADEYFFDHAERWQGIRKAEFGDERPPGS